MKFRTTPILFFLLFLGTSISAQSYKYIAKVKKGELEVVYLASGCFWCVEAIYEHTIGVEAVFSGYSGGHKKSPTYKEVGTGKTGHAETVAIYYNPKKVSYTNLLEIYFGTQNPTTIGQNPDFGSAYRSIIFYKNEKERQIAENMFSILNTTVYKGKMVTKILSFEKFYEAEEYHQDFEKRNPNHRYIKSVSIPRLNHFKRKFPEFVK